MSLFAARDRPDFGELPDLTPVGLIPAARHVPSTLERGLAERDPWFFNHYVVAAHIVADAIGEDLPADARIMDLGCGDGIMAMGVCDITGREVVGSDLTAAFESLPERTAQCMGTRQLPPGLKFVRGELQRALPFPASCFDAAYSWSVFEHVDSIAWLLGEVHRVLQPGGRFFLQIEPLYYSPFGSHLQRLVDRPWAHLLESPTAFLQRVREARDNVPEVEKDMLYRENAFEDVKRYLISEYGTLNKVRSIELARSAIDAGFKIGRCEIQQVPAAWIPADLKPAHSAHDLRTNEIRLHLTR